MPYKSLEERREHDRKYREENREKIRERDRIWKRKNYERVKKNNQKYLERNPEKRKEYAEKYKGDGRTIVSQRKSRYGITNEQFNQLLEKQGNVCPICGEGFGDEPKYVDHSHSTGKIRGIVHRRCNLLLGHAKDSSELLEKAANYLRRHK